MTISRGRFQPFTRPVGKQLRINDQIRISPVRLVDENDAQVGVVELLDAKRRAKEAGLDLVEVAAQATPPVCKIMDYGKWKYQQKKKEQKARSHAKTSELKEIRLRPKIDEHDLSVKLKSAREFLGEGDKVQFTMMFKGREMAHRGIGLEALGQIKTMLSDMAKVETEPRTMGRRITMVLAPDRSRSNSPPAKPAASAIPGAQPTAQPAAAKPAAPKPVTAPKPVATAPAPSSSPTA